MHKISFLLIIDGAIIFKKEFTKRLRPYGLTPEQWALLNRLGEKDGVTQRELSERTFKDQPNTTRILDKLEKKKLIRKANNPEDRRAFIVFLTDKGKEVRNKIIPITAHLNDEAAKGIGGENRRRLIDLLNHVYENLRDR